MVKPTVIEHDYFDSDDLELENYLSNVSQRLMFYLDEQNSIGSGISS
jgi:hypothetical protein